MLSGTYDSFLFERINGLNPSGKTIYDIGSHIGFHALYFARLVGETGVVAAFEPNRANFGRLNENIGGNPELTPRVKAFNMAISDTAGMMAFTTKDDIESGRSMGGFLDKAETHWEKEVYSDKGFSETEAKTIPVDSIPSSCGVPAPDIMKIDVEGAELQALKGARRTLLEKKPALFIEIHSIRSMFDVMTFLQSVSYAAEIVNQELNGICYIQAGYKHAHPLR